LALGCYNGRVTLHREWATFIDARDASQWNIDLTFLASSWTCIYGRGCKGIHGKPVGGCCEAGVFIQVGADDEQGAEDFAKLSDRVEELTQEDWDLVGEYRDSWFKERSRGSRHTRLSDGMCVFQNTGDGPSGTIGCAFHVAAIRRGEDPLDWKPYTCGLVPFAVDHSDDETKHTLRPYEHERDWGSGDGEPLDWWCVDAPEAYIADQALYRTEERLLRRVLGDDLYDEVAAHMDARFSEPEPTPVNWIGHWGVKPPDGTTGSPDPLDGLDDD